MTDGYLVMTMDDLVGQSSSTLPTSRLATCVPAHHTEPTWPPPNTLLSLSRVWGCLTSSVIPQELSTAEAGDTQGLHTAHRPQGPINAS